MAKENLKPCPFCGSDAVTKHNTEKKCFGVGCLNYDCHGYIGLGWEYMTLEDAIAAWNRRVCDE